MPEIELSPEEATEIFGGEVGSITTNADEMEVSLALHTIRDQIVAAAKEDGVGVNQLAHRLDISPSSVSRFLSGEGDVRVSTVVLYGRALGRCWDFSIRRDSACAARSNHSGGFVTLGIDNAVTATAGAMFVISCPPNTNKEGITEIKWQHPAAKELA